MSATDRARLLTALLLVIAISCIIYITDLLTREKIQQNKNAARLAMLESVIPGAHDNDLVNDHIQATIPTYFGTDNPLQIHYVKNAGTTTGVVFLPVQARGYNDLIELAVGISVEGIVTGVRVLSHAETRDLGDNIHQDKSDWIRIFDNTSLQQVPVQAWSVSKNGGVFDQLSGATISSSAVVQAVKQVLEYHEYNREEIY